MDVSIGESIIPNSFDYASYLCLNTIDFKEPNFDLISYISVAYLHWFYYGHKEDLKYTIEGIDMDLFDYDNYVKSNSDLEIYVNQYSIHDRDYIARLHYINNNTRSSIINKRKNFYIQVYNGLFNQLLGVINGIILGHLFKRDVHVDDFIVDILEDRKTVLFDTIFDFNKLNEFLSSIGFYPKIYCNSSLNWDRLSKHNVFALQWFPYSMPLIINELYKDNLDLGWVYTGNHPFYQGINEKVNYAYETILDNLPFTDEFITKAQELKSKLGLDQYFVVHMRVEDDMLDFLVQSYYQDKEKIFAEELYNTYMLIIDECSKDNKVFVATGLFKKENRYASRFREDISKNKNIIVNEFDVEVNGVSGREITGLIEYLVCRDGKFLIGYGFSTFTMALMTHYKIHDKPILTMKYDIEKSEHYVI